MDKGGLLVFVVVCEGSSAVGEVQYIEGSRDEDEDGDMERCGDVELLCGSGEMVLDLVEEARLLFLFDVRLLVEIRRLVEVRLLAFAAVSEASI